MTRGLGGVEAIQALLPEWTAVLVALLTQLGDVWLLTLLLGGLYWTNDRHRTDIALVTGTWLAGLGLYKALKAVFGRPRPDRPLLDPEVLPQLLQPLYEATAFATGYGFPSGHATNTTIVYVGLAVILSVSSRRKRFGAAGLIVAGVCFSRVALGLHYVVDVIAGVATGGTLLLLALAVRGRFPDDGPTATFGMGVCFSAWFLLEAGPGPEPVLLFATAIGGFGGWQLTRLAGGLAAVDGEHGGGRVNGEPEFGRVNDESGSSRLDGEPESSRLDGEHESGRLDGEPESCRLDGQSGTCRSLLVRSVLVGGTLLTLLALLGVGLVQSLYGSTPQEAGLYALASLLGVGTALAIAVPVARHADWPREDEPAFAFWRNQVETAFMSSDTTTGPGPDEAGGADTEPDDHSGDGDSNSGRKQER